MKEVPLGASVSQDRVKVSADDESILVTTAVTRQKLACNAYSLQVCLKCIYDIKIYIRLTLPSTWHILYNHVL